MNSWVIFLPLARICIVLRCLTVRSGVLTPHTFCPSLLLPPYVQCQKLRNTKTTTKNNGQYIKLCTWKLIHPKQQQKRTATVPNILSYALENRYQNNNKNNNNGQYTSFALENCYIYNSLLHAVHNYVILLLFNCACCSQLCTKFWNPSCLTHWFSLPTESSSSVQSLVVILCQVTHPLLSQVASWSFLWVQQEGPYSKFTISGVGQR